MNANQQSDYFSFRSDSDQSDDQDSDEIAIRPPSSDDDAQRQLTQTSNVQTATPLFVTQKRPLPPHPCCSVKALIVWVALLVFVSILGFLGFAIGLFWICISCPLVCVSIGTLVTSHKNKNSPAASARAKSLAVWACWCVLLTVLSYIFGGIIWGVSRQGFTALEFVNRGDTGLVAAFFVVMAGLLVVAPIVVAAFACSRSRAKPEDTESADVTVQVQKTETIPPV